MKRYTGAVMEHPEGGWAAWEDVESLIADRDEGNRTVSAQAQQIIRLEFDLSQGWQQMFYHAQHTIDLQKGRIAELEAQLQHEKEAVGTLEEENQQLHAINRLSCVRIAELEEIVEEYRNNLVERIMAYKAEDEK